MSKIMVDIDYKPITEEEIADFCYKYCKKMLFITNTIGVFFDSTEVYETRKGLHIYHEAHADYELNPIDIVIIQFALGSDYKREVFNYRRAKNWINGESLEEGWNTLYKYKYEKGKLVGMERSNEITSKMQDIIQRMYQKAIES